MVFYYVYYTLFISVFNRFKLIFIFILLSFSISWSFWFFNFNTKGWIEFIGPFGPTIGGLIISILVGKKSFIDYLARCVNVNFKLRWYFVIFGLQLSFAVVSVLIGYFIFGDELKINKIFVEVNLLVLLSQFLNMLVLGGPLAEEGGWRGFLLDRLVFNHQINPIKSAIIVGIIWGLWHLPLFIKTDQEIYHGMPFLVFLIGAIIQSLLHTWIYIETNRSIFASIIFHTTGNFAVFLFPTIISTGSITGLIMQLLNITLLIFVIHRLRKFKIE